MIVPPVTGRLGSAQPPPTVARSGYRAIDLVRSAPTLTPTTRCDAAFAELSERSDLAALPVLDEAGRVVGLVDRVDLLSKFARPLVRAVHERRPVTLLMDTAALVVDADLEVDEIAQLIAEGYPKALVSGFAVEQNQRYLGMALPIDLLERIAAQARSREAALERAKAEADAANEAKTGFLAAMSHEIRTPLNGVIGSLELLRFTTLSPDQVDCVDTAESAAQTLLGLIGDILDFSKIEADRIEIERIEADPAEVVEDVVQLIRPRAVQKRLEIRVAIGPDVPERCSFDPFRLRQVLMNFASNALKFTNDGAIELSVSAVASDRLRFAVTDTGVGFDPARAERLFEAFTQEDRSTSRRYGGTGLGLAISKRLIELMGGRIGCATVQGQGAQFWCEIPAPARGTQRRVPSIAGMAVLLVEPADGVGAVAATVAGAVVQQVHSVAEVGRALRSAITARRRFDAIAVDARLTGQALAGFAAAVAGYGAPVIVLDATGSLAHRLGGLRSGLVVAGNGIALSPRELEHAIAVATGRVAAAKRAQRSSGLVLPNWSDQASALPILVIDDTPMNIAVARRQLAQMGLTCDTAAEGREGLARATAQRYAVILVDVSMPEMDGYEFTRRFRQFEAATPGWTRVPVIAITGNALDGDEQACIDAGMDAYTTKPVQIERLASLLRTYLPTASEPDRRPSPPAPSSQPQSAVPWSSPTGSAPLQRAAIPVMARDPEAVIDLEQFYATIGGRNPTLVAELLSFFIETFIEILHRLGDALLTRDRAAVEAAAHAGKGSARNAAADPLGAVLADLEHGAATAEWSEIEQQVRAVHSGYMLVRMFVADFVRGQNQ
ncbi:MAG: response regulator [Alphaproteobacteria bacterium]|nr:MAG: response regulator [Alphaproteobacteria bacterium]